MLVISTASSLDSIWTGLGEFGYDLGMKLYTGTGDEGDTSLFHGQMVAKDSLRIEVIGAVDELNSHLGLAGAACKHCHIVELMRTLQNRLFDLGADLAMPRSSADDEGCELVTRTTQDQIDEIEHQIDGICADLPGMKYFILPGGSETAARVHVCRTVCRRAERLTVSLSRVEPVGRNVHVYLNRLGDLLFALAREVNKLDGVEDVPWVK